MHENINKRDSQRNCYEKLWCFTQETNLLQCNLTYSYPRSLGNHLFGRNLNTSTLSGSATFTTDLTPSRGWSLTEMHY